MEFMSVGVPVVISSTKVDRFYFDDSVVRFFESGNVEALTEAMHSVLTNPESQRQMVARAGLLIRHARIKFDDKSSEPGMIARPRRDGRDRSRRYGPRRPVPGRRRLRGADRRSRFGHVGRRAPS